MPPVCLPFLCCLVPSVLLSSEHLVSLSTLQVSSFLGHFLLDNLTTCVFANSNISGSQGFFRGKSLLASLGPHYLWGFTWCLFLCARGTDWTLLLVCLSAGEFSIGASKGGSPPAVGRPHRLHRRQNRAPRWRTQQHVLWPLELVHGSTQQWVSFPIYWTGIYSIGSLASSYQTSELYHQFWDFSGCLRNITHNKSI